MAVKITDRYSENIGIRNWLLWIVLIVLLLFFAFASVAQVLMKMPVGDNPLPNWALITGTIFIAFITVLMAQTRLNLELSEEEVFINFGPLGRHQLQWNEVKKVQVARPPISGIGKRQNGPNEIIYNVGSRQSLCLSLKKGTKIWVSTRDAENLKTYLKAIKKLKV